MAGTSGGDWRITGEERAKHDTQFYQLKPVNGFVTGEQAKGFFMQSGLPTPVLGQIWTLADMNNDGKMDRKEFSIAMHLIKKKLQGFELPKHLPASLKADPSPMVGSFGTMPAGGVQPMPMGGAQPMGGMAPMGVAQSMGMAMPMIGGMAPTAMATSSLPMPIMSNGVAPTMGQARFMGGMAPGVAVPGSMADRPRTGSFNQPGPSPGTGVGGSFAMPHPSKLKYTQMFNTNDRNKRGSLTGVEARALLVHTGLPQNILAQIWNLSDVDKDGKLTCDEFCIAMHLCDLAKMGQPLPAVLPPELIPGKARSGSFGNIPPPAQPAAQKPDAFGDLVGGMGMPLQPQQPPAANGETTQEDDKSAVTFEDRRKENFDKGQAELERRRQALADQMKRENEARLEKERQEQEKRERYRQEQERKRLQEMERQLEKQRQIEREKEEQRQKMMEQREAARRELDRQRQMEWERQRKEQLLAEKAREYEQLAAVKLRASNLKCEIESLQGKKTEIGQKIEQVRKGVTDFTSSIESMRETRDTKISDIDKLQKEVQELGDRLIQVQAEKESLNYRVQTTAQSNPLSEPHRTVLHGVELKKTAIQKLKKELESIERETEDKLVEIDNNNAELATLKSKLNDLQQEMNSYQQKQAEKAKQQQEEALAKNRQEKEKQEKLRKELEAQRLKEELEQKQKQKEQSKPKQDDAWFAFGNDSKSTSNASDDIWSSAFSSVKTEQNQTSDIWGNAFSSQTTAPSVSKGKGSKFKAVYPFEARNPDELTLEPDDIVWVPDDQAGAEPGWMGGEKDGHKGWFPKDYVEKLPDSQQSSQNFAIENAFISGASISDTAGFKQLNSAAESPFSDSMEASPTPGQGQVAPDGLQAQALYPWKAKKENHLSFSKGDLINIKEQQDMWWSGELNGQTGWFPKSYVKLVSGPVASMSLQSSRSDTPQSTSAGATVGSSRSTPVVSEASTEGENYVAMFNYSSSEAGDLTFNQGEIVVVTKKDGDWWTGTLNGRTGIFPANYVKKSEQMFIASGLTSDFGLPSVTTSNEQNSPPPIPPHSVSASQNSLSPKLPKTDEASDILTNMLDSTSVFGSNLKGDSKEKGDLSYPMTGEPVKSEKPVENSHLAVPIQNNASSVSQGDMFGSIGMGDMDFTSGFSDDPFASESPFASDSIVSTQSTQSSTGTENKALLEKITKQQAGQSEISSTGSFVELSQFFPDSPIKENPFKENKEVNKDNGDDLGGVSDTSASVKFDIPSSQASGDNFDLLSANVEVATFDLLSANVEVATSASTSDNRGQSTVTNPDNEKAQTPAKDLFADFENQLSLSGDNSNENSSSSKNPEACIQSKANEKIEKTHEPEKTEDSADLFSLDAFANFESHFSKQDDKSENGNVNFDAFAISSTGDIKTDPFADFLSGPGPETSNSVLTDPFAECSSGQDSKPKTSVSSDLFADFANFSESDSSKPSVTNMNQNSQSSLNSFEVSSDQNSEGPDKVPSGFDSLSNISTPLVSGLTSSADAPKQSETDLSDNFDFIQSLRKPSEPKSQSDDAKDIDESIEDLDENFMFIQNLTKSTSKNTPRETAPATSPNNTSPSFDLLFSSNGLQSSVSEQTSVTGAQAAVKSVTPQPTIQIQPPATQVAAPQQQQQVQQPQQQSQQPQQQKASTSSTLKKPEIASVIAAYTATGAEQLSLQPGQIIQVRKKSPSGWWEGELQARGQKKKIGWFPANYVKLLGSSARSTPDASSQSSSPANTLNRTATPTIPPPQPQPSAVTESKYIDQVIALYPYNAQHDDELTFHKDSVINIIKKDDDSWWQGELNGVVGLFPSNYVGPLTQSPPQDNTWSTDPVVLAQTSSTESKRQNHIHELINTEETYMADMSIVLDAFYKPMLESKVMTEVELASVFVNWKELIVCNTKLLKSLRVRKKMCGKGQVINVIGDILCENLPHMGPYVRFCSCQLNAAALIQRKTENSSEFRDIQKKCVQDSRTKGMPLSSFLLKPMQRITKYPLMIEKILQYTPEGHPDRQNLQDALAEAEKLCNQVNEGVRERENCDKLEWIQQAVQCDGLPEKIIFNSLTNCLGPRKILYSGTLYKAKSNKDLVGFLFNDFLLLAYPLSSSTSLFIMDPKSKAQYKMYKHPIFLNEVMVKKVEEDSDPCLFHIAHVDRVFNLKCPSQTERDSWVRNIQAASQIYNDTEKKKREKAYNFASKQKGVGRLLVIIVEGINLSPGDDVKKIPGVGRLLVVILEGCDLQPSDANGKSDPYCEVSMGTQEHKTPVINATLNPKWNKSMQFTIKDVEQDVLCITVYDRDLFSPNDFLGRTEVRVLELLNTGKRGPVTKRLLLHEVSSGEVVVKLDLQLYEDDV